MTTAVQYDLEDRLVAFSVHIIEISEKIKKTKAGNILTTQLLKSGTSPALNYGEVQSSESINDFIHKMKIILKELRETRICLRIIKESHLVTNFEKIDSISGENRELILIFHKSIDTASKRLKKK